MDSFVLRNQVKSKNFTLLIRSALEMFKLVPVMLILKEFHINNELLASEKVLDERSVDCGLSTGWARPER